jgi:hypothetical protein
MTGKDGSDVHWQGACMYLPGGAKGFLNGVLPHSDGILIILGQ